MAPIFTLAVSGVICWPMPPMPPGPAAAAADTAGLAEAAGAAAVVAVEGGCCCGGLDMATGWVGSLMAGAAAAAAGGVAAGGRAADCCWAAAGWAPAAAGVAPGGPTLRIWYWPVSVLTRRWPGVPVGIPWPGCRAWGQVNSHNILKINILGHIGTPIIM